VAVNALAYFIASATMPMLRVEPDQRRGHAPEASVWAEAAHGVRYAARHPGIGPLLLYAAVMAVLLRGIPEILPPYVERLFGQGPNGLAMLTACFGIGALITGLWVASRGRVTGATRLAVVAAAVQALAGVLFVATSWFPVALLAGALLGGAGAMHGISVQTLAQNASDASMRGRILSLWGLITRACPALGALVLGGLGEWFGMRIPTLAVCLLSFIMFAWGMSRLPRMAASLEAPR